MAQQVATQTLPPEVYQLAAYYQLGAPAAEYRRWLRPAGIVTSVLLVVAGCFFFYLAFIGTADIVLPLLIIGVLWIGCALIWPCIFLLNMDHRVYVFTEGLAQVKGNQTDVLRWDQVVSFVQNVTTTTTFYAVIPVARVTTHIYTVQRADGKTLIFRDNLCKVQSLGNTIGRATAQRLTPKAIAAYNSGAPVAFGSLIISQQGISKDQVLLPWYQFQKYEISNGLVIIRQHGRRIRWSATAVSMMPNLLVFIALMDYIRRGQGQGPR
ncbi:MAG TPA: DUF6585 family protein [Ktedonobacterales bacterium]|nr:DUF6585 family protein [Ktedonobacterales bacterium]